MDILYLSKSDSYNDIFRDLTAMAPGKTEQTISAEDIKTRLLEETGRPTLAILIASDIEVLMDLYHFNHLFHKASTILVLPDSEKDTIALGRRMKPNFLLPKEADKEDILSIVGRMLSTPPKISIINSRTTLTINAAPHNTSPVFTPKISNL